MSDSGSLIPMVAEPTPARRVPTSIIILIAVGLFLATATFAVSVVSARTASGARAADILANKQLLERIAELEEQAGRENLEHRQRNEDLHSCIVDLILEIIRSDRESLADIVDPCPPIPIPNSYHSTPGDHP